MQRLSVSTILLCLPLLAAAQDTLNKDSVKTHPLKADSTAKKTESGRSFRAGFTGEYVSAKDFFHHSIGLSLEVPVGRHVSLFYHFALGGANNNSLYAHYPGTFGLGVRTLRAFDGYEGPGSKFFNAIGILLCLVPEGVTFNINPENKTQVIPYVVLAGEDARYSDRNGINEIRTCLEAGSKVLLKLGTKFFAAPHVGVKMYYDNSSFGFEGGVTIGYRSR